MDKMTDLACAELKEYTYAEHRFRFAAWAAGNAAVRGLSLKPAKDKLERKDNEGVAFAVACRMLKKAGLDGIAEKAAEGLPDPEDFDDKHKKWCKKVREKAEDLGIKTVPKYENDRYWSDGRSAKLINVFLKALMPADLEDAGFPAEEKAKWLAVHPPIDSTVLKGMNHKDNEKHGEVRFGYEYPEWIDLPGTNGSPSGIPAWSKFEYKHYRAVIKMIHDDLGGCPFWKNERFFKP